MSSELQHKLLNFEVSPPTDNWNVIASRMNEEFDAVDHVLAEKLEHAAVTPPFQAWDHIVSELNPQREETVVESKPARIILFSTKRVAAAVAILLAAAAVIYFILPGTQNNQDLTGITNRKIVPTSPTIPSASDLPPQVAIVTKASVGNPVIGRIASRYQSRNQIETLYDQASYSEEDSDANMSYANPDRLPKAGVDSKISIPTRPITDPQGNIIMDENLVTTPNTHYITVTGPNGEQTKISRKFLHALSYMNEAINPEDTDIIIHESSLWKWMFQEWRNKLLKEPSFIPSSTNFLDILELKELLNDNF